MTHVEGTDALRQRRLALAGLTIAWNLIEAAVAITAEIAAGSIALVGFGFDSTVEVMSSVVVVWQFRGEARSGYDEQRERRALRLIAVSFFVLAAYVTVESLRDLLVMPALAIAKRRTAGALGSPALRADSRETLLCAWLSAALLGATTWSSDCGAGRSMPSRSHRRWLSSGCRAQGSTRWLAVRSWLDQARSATGPIPGNP